jgi:hypothetical protein
VLHLHSAPLLLSKTRVQSNSILAYGRDACLKLRIVLNLDLDQSINGLVALAETQRNGSVVFVELLPWQRFFLPF